MPSSVLPCPSSRRPRLARYHFGLWAEALCRLFLRLQGYRIIARRHKTPLGEIDIIALRGSVLAVIEVKARATRNEAALALRPRQRERLKRAAALFLGRHPRLANKAVRFDLMMVAPWRLPVHVPNAWQ